MKNWYRLSKIKRLTGTFTVVLKGILDGSVYVKVTLCVSTKYCDDGLSKYPVPLVADVRVQSSIFYKAGRKLKANCYHTTHYSSA